ncbi:fungal-specific transcription factor domain-containing protein [Phaeosphaeriaceae sp. PMI808]|nr:fungal-specific transcription factor domain-containing protein [Phaeosphaeriaceae sp. PMI808]
MTAHKRSRTGCWTCREAGYKCNEEKPHCGRCLRLNITCKGYGVKLKWQDENVSTPAKRPRQAKGKTSAGHKSTSSPTPFSSSSPRTITSSPDSTYSPPFIPFAFPQISIDLPPNDRWLLYYWVERLSALISVSPRKENSTPFQLHLTAMVHDSTALRSTVLSMAANHLALSSNDPSLRVHAYRHQQDAIHELQEMIQDPKQAATEPALATVLMMQVSARLFGDDNDTLVANHLAGAKAMITRSGGVTTWSSPSSTRFLLSLFAYHDILASVSRGTRPLANHETAFAAIEGEADMESIAKVLLTVARISQLQHTIKARKAISADTALSEEEDATGRYLQNLLAMDFTPGHPNAGRESADISCTAEAYRHAAFIYLYRTWLDVGAPNPISMDHVQKCLEYVQQVEVTSPLTSSHVWPLFTAGCEAIDAAERQFVRSRFDEMYTSKKFPSLKRVMRDIEDVWSAKDMEHQTKGQAGMSKVDCIQVILRRRGREVDLA